MSVRYSIFFKPSAKKAFDKLPNEIKSQLGVKIESLKIYPYQKGARKIITTTKNVFRIRSGKYRIIYQIQDGELVVLILRVAHRSKAY
ncbi:MAG: type II toxin-antitoxin system RelE/ParE family toxin [Candidatus Marinimicrobia bacterium]|nr:type II toxin-antitoxin system RelE/ParE family toxin [Candidatus Neomarinimicrobiota bacterium]MBL7030383.1 type II toxin-antitoxin system RelE/ParE family toxin [Candidatus Neomarinimicrobiota bacterium]